MLLAIAIIAAFFVFKKNIAMTDTTTVSKKTDAANATPAVPETQVKGTATSVSSKSQIVDHYTTQEATTRMALTPTNVIWFTNYYRVQNNLPALSISSALDDSAQAKTTDMFTYQYFDHVRPGNTNASFSYFITLERYSYLKAGENLAEGDFTTSKQVVDAWMNSPDHRKNILDPAYRQIGVAVEKGTVDGSLTTLITEHFGEPTSACPSISQVTKSAIDALQTQLANTQTDISIKKSALASDSAQLDPDYNALVDAYNSLVASYDASIKQMQNLVKIYNTQVSTFDQCLAKS